MLLIFHVFILLHGLIHLLGFLKGFGFARIENLTQPISKGMGLLWLIAAVLFLVTSVAYYFDWKWWWLLGFVAILLSQLLIFTVWKDAKFGTLANILVLSVCVYGFGVWNFQQNVEQKRSELISIARPLIRNPILDERVQHLPPILQKWLSHSGILQKTIPKFISLKQHGQMKLSPETNEWIVADAEQRITLEPPGFVWNVKTQFYHIPVFGLDQFQNGQGSMKMLLAGILPVVSTSNHPKTNESTLQRYLSEMIWYPHLIFHPSVSFQELDSNKVEFTMTVNQTVGKVVFHFNETGETKKITANRFKDIQDETPTDWEVVVTKYKSFSEYRLPSQFEVSWFLKSGKFMWFVCDVSEIKFSMFDTP